MTETQEPPGGPCPSQRWAAGGPWFAAIWLFFLLDPLLVAWRHRDTVSSVPRLWLLTLAFCDGVHVCCGFCPAGTVPTCRMRPPTPVAVVWFTGLALGSG